MSTTRPQSVTVLDCPAATQDAIRDALRVLDLQPGDRLWIAKLRKASLEPGAYLRTGGGGGDPSEYEAQADRMFGGAMARWREEER